MPKAKKEPNESVVQVTRILGTEGHLNLLPDVADMSIQVEAVNTQTDSQTTMKLGVGADLRGLMEQLKRLERYIVRASEQ